MRQKFLALLPVLTLAFAFSMPSALHAEDSYIDQLARQVQQDIQSGAIKDKVKPVDTTTQTTPPAQPQTPPRSQYDRELDQLHLARFFGTILGPDEFSKDEFWEGPDDESGDYMFGDSLINVTHIDYLGTGNGRVIGSDTDYARPWSVNDNILRDAINSNDFSTLSQRLIELGYRTGEFRIEAQ